MSICARCGAAGAQRSANRDLALPPEAFANSRLATLAQAISRTAPTAPSKHQQRRTKSAHHVVEHRVHERLSSSLKSGYCCASRASMACNPCAPRTAYAIFQTGDDAQTMKVAARSPAGRARAEPTYGLRGISKPLGITPITVRGRPSRSVARNRSYRRRSAAARRTSGSPRRYVGLVVLFGERCGPSAAQPRREEAGIAMAPMKRSGSPSSRPG